MAIEVFNRYEHKYILNEQTYARLQDALEQHMTLDPYNIDRKPYTITNLYYDTPDDYLIRASLSDPVYKEKLRLRAYGVPEKNSKVFLEIKKKYDGLVNKRRTALGLDEAYVFAKAYLSFHTDSVKTSPIYHRHGRRCGSGFSCHRQRTTGNPQGGHDRPQPDLLSLHTSESAHLYRE